MLCVDGKGPMQIAKLLTAGKVLTVKAYYAKRDRKSLLDNLYRWDFKTVAGILGRLEYTGCTVNFKTYSKSHKLKKRLNNAPENYRIFLYCADCGSKLHFATGKNMTPE